MHSFLDVCPQSPTLLTDPRVCKGRPQWNTPISLTFNSLARQIFHFRIKNECIVRVDTDVIQLKKHKHVVSSKNFCATIAYHVELNTFSDGCGIMDNIKRINGCNTGLMSSTLR